jgi:hypothetical protein
MRELTIYRLYFTNSDCFKKGVRQRPMGVQVHSTGANNPWLRRYVGPDDGRLGPNLHGNTHNRPGGNVCANAYIGKLVDGTVAVYQALPWDMRCWLSGSGPNGNANHLGYVGFEICEDSTENEPYFLEAVREKAVLLTAHLCQMMGVKPDQVVQETKNGPAHAVMDHESLHRVGLASNHGDIGLWLRKHGCTFRDFRAWVQEALDEGVHVNYIDAQEKEGAAMEHPILRRGDSGSAVIYLQTLLGDTGAALRADGIFGAVTEAVVKEFQAINRLTMDGIVGPQTWAALEKATGHDAEGLELAIDENDTVSIWKSDWNAIRAAYAAISGIIRKYENVG